MEAERMEEGTWAEQVKTAYSAVEHLGSFWEAVFHFIALKEAEGQHVAADLMTECVATRISLANVGNEGEFMTLRRRYRRGRSNLSGPSWMIRPLHRRAET